MSTFRQLMMRKKEEIMYATIKGTLTESDGVFSGFSASNYLEIPNVPTYTQDDKLEFVTNFTLTTINDSTLCGGAGAFCVPVVNSSGKIQYFGSALGLSGSTGANTLVVNQNYYFKAIYDTTSFNTYISTDGINWVLDYSKSVSTTFSRSGAFQLGRNLNVSTQYLKGSMNLNKSYIKLGATKYNLQAIVGYTIVGSPTITDGVVSGFSSSNYLQLPSKPDYNDNFEMQVEFTKTATGNCGLCVGGTYTYGGLMASNNTVRFTIRLDDGTSNNYALVSNNTIEINALYIANVKRVGNKIVLRIYKNGILDEEIGDDLTNIAFSTNIGNLRLGVRVGGDALSGSINLNNTYIKINNKLWFNGQEA